MKQIIQKIESRFEQLGRWIHVHPKRVILVMLLFFAILASNLPSIQVDTSTEAFFSENDQTRITYDKFREQFGRDEIVLALIHPQKVFDIEFLKKLKAFHEDLEVEVPHLDEVQSLINVTAMRGEGGELIIEELMADWPEDDAGVKDLKERVLRNKFYRNFLVSEDGQYTTVVIRSNAFSDEGTEIWIRKEYWKRDSQTKRILHFPIMKTLSCLPIEQNSEFVEAIQVLAERHRNTEFPIDLGGSPVMVHDLKKAMFSDMPVFVLSSLGVIALLLVILFRRLSGLVLPILTVIFSLLTCSGSSGRHRYQTDDCFADTPFFLTCRWDRLFSPLAGHILPAPERAWRERGGYCFCNGPFGSGDSYHQSDHGGGSPFLCSSKSGTSFRSWVIWGGRRTALCFLHSGSLASPAFGSSRRETCVVVAENLDMQETSRTQLSLCRPDAQRLW